MDNICQTGDAEGSDRAWLEVARSHGHKTRILLPQCRHGTKIEADEVLWPDVDVTKYFPIVAKLARNILRRPAVLSPAYKHIEYQYRDLAQVLWPDPVLACYAIAITDFGNRQWPIQGGTAWATATFWLEVDRNKLFIYSIRHSQWGVIDQDNNDNYIFRSLLEVPKPRGTYAAIGTRDISQERAVEIISEIY